MLPVWVSWVSAFTLSQVKNQAKSFQKQNSYDIKQKEIKIYRWTCVVITKRADAIQNIHFSDYSLLYDLKTVPNNLQNMENEQNLISLKSKLELNIFWNYKNGLQDNTNMDQDGLYQNLSDKYLLTCKEKNKK